MTPDLNSQPPGPVQYGAAEPGKHSGSLMRGLAILRWFSAEHTTGGIAEIAADLGLTRSTTHRYASTLLALGYLERAGSRRYRLAPRASDIGDSAIASLGLRERLHPELERLREDACVTAVLGVLSGVDVLVVDSAASFRSGQYRLALSMSAGACLPAHLSSLGKAMLAHVGDVLPLAASGPSATARERLLHGQLVQTREQGFARGDNELAPGLESLAAPIYTSSGRVVAAIGLKVLNASLPITSSVLLVTDAAHRCTELLRKDVRTLPPPDSGRADALVRPIV